MFPNLCSKGVYVVNHAYLSINARKLGKIMPIDTLADKDQFPIFVRQPMESLGTVSFSSWGNASTNHLGKIEIEGTKYKSNKREWKKEITPEGFVSI